METKQKYKCGLLPCSYTCDELTNILRHKRNVHLEGTIFYCCKFLDCAYKARENKNLKTHLSLIHDVGVTFHHCDFLGCNHTSKTKSNLTKHKKIHYNANYQVARSTPNLPNPYAYKQSTDYQIQENTRTEVLRIQEATPATPTTAQSLQLTSSSTKAPAAVQNPQINPSSTISENSQTAQKVISDISPLESSLVQKRAALQAQERKVKDLRDEINLECSYLDYASLTEVVAFINSPREKVGLKRGREE